jgi:hypothetical protein
LSTARTATPQSTEGHELDRDEIADYEQLRRLVSREQSLKLLDDFATWLFPTAAVVGALGAGFGASSANSLDGTGRTLFAVAVALVGGSLALAALARLPLPGRVFLYSRQSMAVHVDRVVMLRGVLLTLAAILFSIALVVAGISPLFS